MQRDTGTSGVSPTLWDTITQRNRMHQCHCTVALRQSTNRVLGADFCADILGDAAMTHDIVPLAIEPRCGNRVADAHTKIEEVENRREDGSDDA